MSKTAVIIMIAVLESKPLRTKRLMGFPLQYNCNSDTIKQCTTDVDSFFCFCENISVVPYLHRRINKYWIEKWKDNKCRQLGYTYSTLQMTSFDSSLTPGSKNVPLSTPGCKALVLYGDNSLIASLSGSWNGQAIPKKCLTNKFMLNGVKKATEVIVIVQR